MNNQELILFVSKKSGVDKSECQKVMKALEEVLTESLSEKNSIRGFLNFLFSITKKASAMASGSKSES